MMDESLNWAAVILGTVLAYGLGMLWFGPKMFGKSWAEGSHNIKAPDAPPMAAMVVQLVATFLLALVVGLTAMTDALGTALAAIFAAAFFVAGMDLFSQKSPKAVLIDAGYVVAGGALMIVAQGVL